MAGTGYWSLKDLILMVLSTVLVGITLTILSAKVAWWTFLSQPKVAWIGP